MCRTRRGNWNAPGENHNNWNKPTLRSTGWNLRRWTRTSHCLIGRHSPGPVAATGALGAASGAVAGADCEGGGGADSEAAADAVPVSSEVGASERDCVEVPLTRPVAVPSFAEAAPERDALVVGEGEPE